MRHANAVCFDVDSTVITEEGIDVLAEFNGAGAAVAEWTRKLVGYIRFLDAEFLVTELLTLHHPVRAMGGQVLFQDALSEIGRADV